MLALNLACGGVSINVIDNLLALAVTLSSSPKFEQLMRLSPKEPGPDGRGATQSPQKAC
jgi:hypothetical protein